MTAEVQSALVSIMDDLLFQLGSCKTDGAKNLTTITKVCTEYSKSECYTTNATSLVNSLERTPVLSENIKCYMWWNNLHTLSLWVVYTTQRERVWRLFHHINKQEIDLPLHWSLLFRDLGKAHTPTWICRVLGAAWSQRRGWLVSSLHYRVD